MTRARTGHIATLTLAIGLLTAGVLHAAEAPSAGDDASRPFVVKIHADWCGTCGRLEKPLQALEEKVGDGARFVVLDVTDRDTTQRAGAEADRLGLRAFFDANKGKTGTVGVIHGATREPVQVFKGELDPSRYETAIETARNERSS